jgi:PBP1b-binding outer membrane lipoprotein LpoB
MMKRLRMILCSGLLLLIVAGCASINYNEIAPNAKTFQPKVAVVLPAIKMPEGTEQDVDKVAKAIFDAAVATKRFERVIDPMTAKSQMSDNGDLQGAVMAYTAKLRSLAVSDKDSALKIGEILQADTIIVGEVSKWGYGIYAGEKNGEVGMAIKMVDVATGAIYWKAAHAAKETYSLFKPDLTDMATKLAKKIFEYMPKQK